MLRRSKRTSKATTEALAFLFWILKGRLAHRLASLRAREGRETLVLDWSRARGRVSSTEVADLTGLSKVSAGRLLSGLADARRLKGGRDGRRGRGFFYVPVDPGE